MTTYSPGPATAGKLLFIKPFVIAAKDEAEKRVIGHAGLDEHPARPLAPADLVRQTIESLAPRAEAKGLRLHSEIADDVPPWVLADSDRLRQVLLNLTGNALKFTDRGTVSVGLRAEPDPTGSQRLILTVEDTGPGIPPEQQGKLFTPFSRLAQTADKEGAGLGLALCAALCRAMGGGLTVESDGWNGSRFTATLLLAPAAAPASPAPRALWTGMH